MIPNRRRLLTVAAVASVLSTHAARAAETVIGAILEEVSRISCGALPMNTETIGSKIATVPMSIAGVATMKRSGKRTGESATAKKSATTAKIAMIERIVAIAAGITGTIGTITFVAVTTRCVGSTKLGQGGSAKKKSAGNAKTSVVDERMKSACAGWTKRSVVATHCSA